MNAWPFIIAAYVLTLVATAAIAVIAYAEMRRTERVAAETRRRD